MIKMESFNKMKEDLKMDEYPSLQGDFMNSFYYDTWCKFNEHLRQYLIYNINAAGFYFSSEIEFTDFIKTRLHRITCDGKIHKFELYIDYIDENNQGIFVGKYSDEIDIKWDGNTVTATIG